MLYCRVSSKEQEEEGFSIPAQTRLLRDYATRKGFEVVHEFEEADTAKTTGRKAFELMLKFLRERPGTAILVEKTDRLYRNFTDFVKVDDLGAELHFVKEGQVISPTSHSSDKLMHSIKVCIAKNYVDNLSEEIRKGMKEKAMQGIYPSHAPLGYINQVRNGRKIIVLDPERAPIIKRLFEEYALDRKSLKQLTAMAADLGLQTKKGRKVHVSQLHKLLRNDVYVGRIPWNGMTFDGIHEPLVGADIFQRVQEIFASRNSARGYGSEDIAYRGLITCSLCGCLYVGEIKKGKYIYYHCCGRQTSCPAPYVREQVLTEALSAQLELLNVPIAVSKQIERQLMADVEGAKAEAQLRRKSALAKVEKLRTRLANLYEDKLAGEITPETYTILREKYQNELASEEAFVDGNSCTSAIEFAQIVELVSSAADRFKQGDSKQRREALKSVYSNFFFDGKSITPELLNDQVVMLEAIQMTNKEIAGDEAKIGQIENWWR